MPLGLLCSMALVSWQAAVEGVEEGASGMTANFSATWVGGGNVYFSFDGIFVHSRHWFLPLLSSMRKWRTLITDTDPTSHRVRLWRGGSVSSLFFYLFFYWFVEYVHIDALTYLKAPGPCCGAEGTWRNVALSGSASV